MITVPLEPDRAALDTLGQASLRFIADYLDRLPDEPVNNPADARAVVGELLAPPPEQPGDLDALLRRLDHAAAYGLNPASGGYLAYFPANGLPSSALAEAIAQILNRFTGFAALAPGLIAMEHSVIRWFADLFGLPAQAGGLVVSGGSLATLPAVVAARDAHDARDGVIYVGEYAHYCVAKSAHLAGFRAEQVRVVPSSPDQRMDAAEAARLIAADRAAGRRPFLLVATAGATSTGLVDPLGALAEVARREDLWFHVDGAYGAPFQLTSRGRSLLAGIEQADSIVLDPHKSLFLPYGTGIVLVRDESTLRAAHTAGGDYLQDIEDGLGLPDYANLGPELTREWRGLRLWLPLHLHGVAAFRDALDEKLDLARWTYEQLAAEPRLELPWRPDLTVLEFRLRGRDASANERLLQRINASQRVFVSSTRIGGQYTLRMCPQGLRTHAAHVRTAVELIRAAL